MSVRYWLNTNLGENRLVLLEFSGVWLGSLKSDLFTGIWTGFQIKELVQNMIQ